MNLYKYDVHASALPSDRRGLAQGQQWLVRMQGFDHLSPAHLHHLNSIQQQRAGDCHCVVID